MNSSETLKYLLSHAPADIQLCASAFAVISGAPEEEQPELFKTFVCSYGETPTDETLALPDTMDESDMIRALVVYGRKVDSYYEELQKKMLPEHELYKELWDYIRTDPELPDEQARVVALYNMAIDKCFPYCPIDRSAALRMSDLEYNGKLAEIGEDTLRELTFILCANFEQLTERASMVLHLMDRFPDESLKTVLMSSVLSFYLKEIEKLRLEIILGDD